MTIIFEWNISQYLYTIYLHVHIYGDIIIIHHSIIMIFHECSNLYRVMNITIQIKKKICVAPEKMSNCGCILVGALDCVPWLLRLLDFSGGFCMAILLVNIKLISILMAAGNLDERSINVRWWLSRRLRFIWTSGCPTTNWACVSIHKRLILLHTLRCLNHMVLSYVSSIFGRYNTYCAVSYIPQICPPINSHPQMYNVFVLELHYANVSVLVVVDASADSKAGDSKLWEKNPMVIWLGRLCWESRENQFVLPYMNADQVGYGRTIWSTWRSCI